MSNGFEFITIYLDSSEEDTDPGGLAEAIKAAGGDLIEDVHAQFVSSADDDTEDDFPPGHAPGNLGQYTQPIEIYFTREVTEEELERIMDQVDQDSFGFGNGWE